MYGRSLLQDYVGYRRESHGCRPNGTHKTAKKQVKALVDLLRQQSHRTQACVAVLLLCLHDGFRYRECLLVEKSVMKT